MEATIMTTIQWMSGAVAAVCVLGATSFPSVAEACHGHMMHGQMQSGHDQHDQDEAGESAHYLKHLLKHAKEIGLTPEQIGKLKVLQLEFNRTEARLEADIKVAKLELKALLEDEKADLAAIKTRVNQLQYAEGALMFAAIKAKHDGMGLLTSDQREKDLAIHEQMKSGAQHGGGMGGMMGGMGGGMMGGSGHGQGSGDHGSGGSGGAQQHQH
jgi:hypothetical protein